MNRVIMSLTWRNLLGRRRAWLLAVGPALLFGIAALTRWDSGGNPETTAGLTGHFAMGTLLPLMCLLIATGVISQEIEDGSIVYLLAKPLPRSTIALSKLGVALVASLAFAALPTVAAVGIAGDEGWRLASAYAVAASLAAVGYTTVFFAIAIMSRNAIIVGLIYSILWETTLGGYVPGVQKLSIRQWALAPAEGMLRDHPTWGVDAEVGVGTGVVLLVTAIVVATILAVRRLETLPIRSSD